MDEGEGLSEDAPEGKTPSAPERKTPATYLRTGTRDASRERFVPPEKESEMIFEIQKEIINAWIEDPDHPATEAYRNALELYAQLNDSEFAYVSELQNIYDETRCFF